MGLQGIKDRQTDWCSGSGHNDCRMVGKPDRPEHCVRYSSSGLYGYAWTICGNHQLSPDIEVYNTPEKALAGEDQQLEAAVQEMLKTIGEKK